MWSQYVNIADTQTTCHGNTTFCIAARLVTGTRKFDRGLECLLQDDLHWLDVPERVQFKLGLTVRRCLRRRAPPYLVDYCMSVANIVSRQHLRSASHRQLVVPRHRLSTIGRQAFAVAGPMSWNLLPYSLRESACDDKFQTTVLNIHWKHFSLVDIDVPSSV